MKTAGLAILAAGIAVHGQGTEQRKIDICTGNRLERESIFLAARQMTGRMFAGIGVTIQWVRMRAACPPNAIQIRLRDEPAEFRPGALAYALPYEGTNIYVLLNRVRATAIAGRQSELLAHVMAHEIAHLLQGISRHSHSGVMKANWDARDCFQMTRKPLEFTAHDIELIRAGLEDRSLRLQATCGVGVLACAEPPGSAPTPSR